MAGGSLIYVGKSRLRRKPKNRNKSKAKGSSGRCSSEGRSSGSSSSGSSSPSLGRGSPTLGFLLSSSPSYHKLSQVDDDVPDVIENPTVKDETVNDDVDLSIVTVPSDHCCKFCDDFPPIDTSDLNCELFNSPCSMKNEDMMPLLSPSQFSFKPNTKLPYIPLLREIQKGDGNYDIENNLNLLQEEKQCKDEQKEEARGENHEVPEDDADQDVDQDDVKDEDEDEEEVTVFEIPPIRTVGTQYELLGDKEPSFQKKAEKVKKVIRRNLCCTIM